MRAIELADGLFSIQFDHNLTHGVHVMELVPPNSSLRTFGCDHSDCIDMALISPQDADCPHVRTIRDAADGNDRAAALQSRISQNCIPLSS